jgi:hypothetical protein
MKRAILVDTSEEWIGIIVGEESILRLLNFRLKKEFGKSVHMKELKLGEKFRALRVFNHIFSQGGVSLYSLRLTTNKWWAEFIEWVTENRISTLYVDLEVDEELKRRGHRLYLKLLNIYAIKEDVQCADVLAYGDSHHDLVRNIWKDISISRERVL